jgi:hypothetical protein
MKKILFLICILMIVTVCADDYSFQGFHITYDSGGPDIIHDIAVDSEGSIYIVGDANKQSYVGKFKPDGTNVWKIQREKETAYGIALNNNKIYVTGYVIDKDRNIYIREYSASGESLNMLTYNGTGKNNEAYSIAIDKNNSIFIAGKEDGHWKVLKYDSGFNEKWNHVYDKKQGQALDIAISNGYVYVTGYINDRDRDHLIIKYDLLGNIIWEKDYDSEKGDDEARGIVANNKDVYVAGYVMNNQGDTEYYIVKYNSDGDYQWHKSINLGEGGFAEDIDIDDAGIYVTGWFGANFNYDWYSLKYDFNGVQLWKKSHHVGDLDRAYAIKVFNNSIYVAGSANPTLDSGYLAAEDLFLIKYKGDDKKIIKPEKKDKTPVPEHLKEKSSLWLILVSIVIIVLAVILICRIVKRLRKE